MATNRRQVLGRKLSLTCTDPATPASGDPVICGKISGVALTAERADGTTSVDTMGVYAIPVKGTTGSNAAIAAGDLLYYVSANTPKVSATSSGIPIGWALEAVGSGLTATIKVKLSGGAS